MSSIDEDIRGFLGALVLDEALTKKQAERQYAKQQKGRKEIMRDVTDISSKSLISYPKYEKAVEKRRGLEQELSKLREQRKSAKSSQDKERILSQIKKQEERILAQKEAIEELKVYLKTKRKAPKDYYDARRGERKKNPRKWSKEDQKDLNKERGYAKRARARERKEWGEAETPMPKAPSGVARTRARKRMGLESAVPTGRSLDEDVRVFFRSLDESAVELDE